MTITIALAIALSACASNSHGPVSIEDTCVEAQEAIKTYDIETLARLGLPTTLPQAAISPDRTVARLCESRGTSVELVIVRGASQYWVLRNDPSLGQSIREGNKDHPDLIAFLDAVGVEPDNALVSTNGVLTAVEPAPTGEAVPVSALWE